MMLDVLYQFNEKYAPYAGVSITSLFRNNMLIGQIRVFILGENLSEDSILRFRELEIQYGRQIIFLDSEQLINKMINLKMPTYRGSYAANMRLFLADIMDEEIDKLLYLDADTLINQSLEELIHIDMGTYPIAMVLDSLGGEHKKDIGLTDEDYYFNSGVVLFQMKEWRKQNYSAKIIEHIQNIRAHYPAPDQDLLNVVCKKSILLLNPKYNYQPIHIAFSSRSYFRFFRDKQYYRWQTIEEAGKNVAIYHFFRFVGEFPWNLKNVHPDNTLFNEYLQISPWNDYIKQTAEVGGFLKIEKILYQILPRGVFLGVFKIAHYCFINKANKQSLEKKINKCM